MMNLSWWAKKLDKILVRSFASIWMFGGFVFLISSVIDGHYFFLKFAAGMFFVVAGTVFMFVQLPTVDGVARFRRVDRPNDK